MSFSSEGGGDNEDDEGFDPAFADDDAALASLGASLGDDSFASTSFLSDSFPLASPPVSFPPQNFDFTHDDEGSASRYGRHGDENGNDECDEPPQLRRSRGAGGAPASNRLSLAFELASVSAPGHANRDLMRELGIKEDDEEVDEAPPPDVDHDSSDDTSDVDLHQDREAVERVGARQEGSGPVTPRASRISLSTSKGAGVPSPGRRSLRSGTASTESLPAEFDKGGAIAAANGGADRNDLAREEEADASFLAAKTTLESSLAMTGTFLARLRQYTVGTVGGSEVGPRIEGASESALDFTDRQPRLETLATVVVRSMYDVAKQREQQLRELTDLERLVSRTTNDASLPESSTEHPGAEEGNGDAEPVERLSYSITSTGRASARVELSALRDVTASLVSALAALNEVAQVNQARVGDAGRKLRAMRGHVAAARDDVRSVERSEAFIREYERSAGHGRKGRYAELAREAVSGAQAALDEGWRRAQEVLVTTT